jgi:hypothetical protein
LPLELALAAGLALKMSKRPADAWLGSMAHAATRAAKEIAREFAELHGKPPLLNHSLLLGQKWGGAFGFQSGRKGGAKNFFMDAGMRHLRQFAYPVALTPDRTRVKNKIGTRSEFCARA